MVCKCRDGTYGPQCCQNQGGRVSSRRSTPARSPSHTMYGSTPGKMLIRAGEIVQDYGSLKQSAALVASHPIQGKIWTQYSRRELVAQKRKTSNTQISQPVKKYDARPERWTGAQKRHWERRPMGESIYSNPRKGNVALYRARKYASASAVKHSGTAMKGLGYAYYGYIAYEAYKDPKLVPKLLIAGIPQLSPYEMQGVTYNPETEQLQGLEPQDNPFTWDNVKSLFPW